MKKFFYFTGDRGRRRSKFVLYRRPKANGVVKSRNYKVNEAKSSQAVLNVQQHSISYTLSKNKAVIEEYTHSDHTDLFQVNIYSWPQKRKFSLKQKTNNSSL